VKLNKVQKTCLFIVIILLSYPASHPFCFVYFIPSGSNGNQFPIANLDFLFYG